MTYSVKQYLADLESLDQRWRALSREEQDAVMHDPAPPHEAVHSEARQRVLDLCWKLDFRKIRGGIDGVDYGYMIRRGVQKELFEAILAWREEVATQPTERGITVDLYRETPDGTSPDGVKR